MLDAQRVGSYRDFKMGMGMVGELVVCRALFAARFIRFCVLLAEKIKDGQLKTYLLYNKEIQELY